MARPALRDRPVEDLYEITDYRYRELVRCPDCPGLYRPTLREFARPWWPRTLIYLYRLDYCPICGHAAVDELKPIRT